MSMELLLLTPYVAITASLLLVVTVAVTCHMQTTPAQLSALSEASAAYARPTRYAGRQHSAIINSRSKRGNSSTSPALTRKHA
jgi:hypothetical protein